jgi:omega-6 fatty acid desaturase (delta-12 desaturase)
LRGLKEDQRETKNEMQVRPLSIDRLTRTDAVRLKDLKDVIPAECYEIKRFRSWLTLIRIVSCIAILTLAIHHAPISEGLALLWQVPLLMSLWVLQGWTMMGLFVLGHDCGHRAFSKNKWVNKLIGTLCFSPLSNALHTWTVTHDHHHAHTQRRGEEVDWAAHLKTEEEFNASTWKDNLVVRLGYALPFGIFFWIITNTIRRGFLVRRQIGDERFAKERKELMISNLLMLLTLSIIYVGLYSYGGLWAIFKYYGIPGTITTLSGALVITVQHSNRHTLSYTKEAWSPLRGQIVSTFDVRFPRFIEWLWLDISIHIPHHVAPSMPWYHLRKAGTAIRTAFPEYYQSQKFSMWHLDWFAKTPFLIEDSDRGFYSMDLDENSLRTTT